MLGDVGLSLVHVLDQGLEVLEVNVLHHDDRVLIVEEGGLKQRLK